MHTNGFSPLINNARQNLSLLYGIVLASAFAIYIQAIGFDFIQLDDPSYVLDNPFVTGGLSLKSIRWAFSWHNLNGNLYYFPLTWLSFVIDGTFWGKNAGGYHFTNVALFCLDCALLMAAWLKLFNRVGVAFLAALLFAVHPMRVESVAWVVERKDLLSGAFLLLTLNSYLSFLGKAKPKDYWLALFFFACGLLSKPSVVTLPVLLFLVDFAYAKSWNISAPGLNATSVKRKAPFFILAALSGGITLLDSSSLRVEMPGIYRFSTMGASYLHHLTKTFLPINLYLSEKQFQFLSINHYVSAAVLVGILCVCAFLFLRRNELPLLFFGWFWFIISFAPMNGFIPTGNIIWSEKFSFIPHMGLMVGLAAIAVHFFRSRARTGVAALVVILALLGGASFVYASKWRNSYTLYTDIIAKNGPKGYAYTSLANLAYNKGEDDKALALLKEGEALDPNGFDELYFLRGLVLQRKNLPGPAIESYLKAASLNQLQYRAMANAAYLYDQLGDYANAARYYLMAENAKRLSGD